MRRFLVPLALPFLLLLGITVTQPACPGPGPVIATAAIECVKENPQSISAVYNTLLDELQAKITAGDPFDWGAASSKALAAGKNIGGCALAKLVQWYLGGNRGAPPEETWKARSAFEDYRDKNLGGATVKVEIDGKILEL